MIEYDKNSHLLTEIEHNYDLQDVKEPHLYREIFPFRTHAKGGKTC